MLAFLKSISFKCPSTRTTETSGVSFLVLTANPTEFF